MELHKIESVINKHLADALISPSTTAVEYVDGDFCGGVASVYTIAYTNYKDSGYKVIGRIKFSNGLVIHKCVDMGYQGHSCEWPENILEEHKKHNAIVKTNGFCKKTFYKNKVISLFNRLSKRLTKYGQ